ncbi:hypothetical protein [Burkholderia cenocepacia]|uniref:hypothetical protein n=1 Tax=Burkholderia cenocepacia TaxID=95486 RepID=UPI0024B63A73|nr:hypothetical protein [Burkholderia cenocepacia]MDI9689783.1 hypothetical protein [Burkholderia cenocepacia]
MRLGLRQAADVAVGMGAVDESRSSLQNAAMPSSTASPLMNSTCVAAPDSLQMLWEIASSARHIHLVLLQDALGKTETQGSCLYASAHLASMVNRFSTWHAKVRAGTWRSADGREHGHYWVQAQLHEAQFMLDITADQFGLPEVLVLPLPAALAWQADDSICVDEHLAEAQIEVLRDKAPSVART